MTRQEEARRAIQWHKEQAERGESPWSCRLYDGEDNGRPGQRCWLIPGHQCDCMNEHRARWEAGMGRATFRNGANGLGLDMELMAHNDAERRIYALQLGNKTHLVSADEAAAAELRAAGIQIAACDDEQAMAPLLATMHPQARGLMESGLARSLERLGRAAEMAALLASVPDVPTFGDEERSLNPFYQMPRDMWEIAPTKLEAYHIPDSGPNAGKQAPPPRQEWWANNAHKGSATPGNGDPWNNPYRDNRGVKAHPLKKASRKAQKQARKGQRSKK